MVETASGVSAESMLDLLPVAVAMLMGQTEQDNISFLGEVLGFLNDIDEHLLNGSLIRCNLLLDQNRCLSLETVDSLCTIELLLDVSVVIQCLEPLKEDFQVLLHLIGSLSAYMSRNRLALLSWVQLECLTDFLVVPSVPVRESTLKENLLLDAFSVCKLHIVHTLQVAAIL